MNRCDVSQVPHGLNRRSLGREFTKAERFRQEGIQRFDADYRQNASNHSTSRNEAVAELLCYLSLLRSAKAIRQHAVINWDRARYQSFRASEGRQAAHVLPCQLLIDGRITSSVLMPALLENPAVGADPLIIKRNLDRAIATGLPFDRLSFTHRVTSCLA